MPPYRRTFVIFCILAPLFYIYWWKFIAPDTLSGLLSSTASENVFNKTLGVRPLFSLFLYIWGVRLVLIMRKVSKDIRYQSTAADGSSRCDGPGRCC